jgi:hypothetical protein
MNNFAAQGNSGMDWIFDSGASSHMSSSSNMLSNFSSTPFSSIILGQQHSFCWLFLGCRLEPSPRQLESNMDEQPVDEDDTEVCKALARTLQRK